jgi:hypothetical protein
LGRTNKAVPLNNVQLDANGNPIPGTGTNQLGRYALHFHRDYYPGLNGNDPPIQVVGNFEAGSPGWGYVNHSSNVDFVNNVAYDNFGAAFVTEAGNELGAFDDNLAIRSVGIPNGANSFQARSKVQDFGQGGEGFWLTSPGTAVTNNIAMDCQVGYGIFTIGLIQEGLGTTRFWMSTTNPAQTADTGFVPFVGFSGDTASNVTQGLQVWNQNLVNGKTTTIQNFTSWGVTNQGINLSSSDINVHLQNDTLLAAPGNTAYGVRLNTGYDAGIYMTGMDVEGFRTGTNLPTHNLDVINGGYWDNQTNFSIQWANGPRQLVFTGPITFGPHSQLDYHLAEPNPSHYIFTFDSGEEPNAIFTSDQILLPNGQQLYYTIQAANYVPFPMASAQVPAQFIGLTNAQLLQQFGVTPGGVIAPTGATTNPSTDGLIGSAVTEPPTPDYTSPMSGQAGSLYTLTYRLDTPTSHAGPYYTIPPVVLQTGWNVIMATVNGNPYSWVVEGGVFSNPNSSLSSGTVGVAYNKSITAPAGYSMSFAVTSGTIPAGLTFSTSVNTLTVAGTPTVSGTVSFNLTATDAAGVTTTQNYTLTVNPENVSGQVRWTASAQTYNPSTQTYDSVITLTNKGPTTLTGTLAIALTGLPTSVTTLANANGTYQGNPYVLVSLPGGTLAAGQTVTFTVQFRFPMKGYGLTTYEQSL